jgi:hypothetical protein
MEYEPDQLQSDTEEFQEEDFVEVFRAASTDEAEKTRLLLEDHDIPSIIGEPDEEQVGPIASAAASLDGNVAVRVPELYLEEAEEIIADSEDVAEFLDVEDQEYASDPEADEDEPPLEMLDDDEDGAAELYGYHQTDPDEQDSGVEDDQEPDDLFGSED